MPDKQDGITVDPYAESDPEPEPDPTPESAPTPPDDAPAPVTASVTQDAASGLWTADVQIAHGDQTVIRVNGRAVWSGTP